MTLDTRSLFQSFGVNIDQEAEGVRPFAALTQDSKAPEPSPVQKMAEEMALAAKPEEPKTREVPEMFSSEDILSIAPKANPEIVNSLVQGQGVLQDYGINTPERLSAFFGQMAHESGGFKALEEYASGDAYEGRSNLGNTQEGDGRRFKGRGIIQLTGRYNYKKYGDLIGVDLESNPELAADPNTAVKIAAAYWKDRGLNSAADSGDFGEITKRIQGTSTDAIESRLGYFNKARRTLQLREVGGGQAKIAVPMFDYVSEEERNRLVKEVRSNKPVFNNKNAKEDSPAKVPVRQPANASPEEIFSAAMDEMRYLNTIGGKEALSNKIAQGKISEAKITDPNQSPFLELLKKDPTYENLELVTSNMAKVGITPLVNMKEIDASIRTEAKRLSKEYEDQHYGSFGISIPDSLRAVGNYAASFAGMTAGVLSDPASALIGLYGPSATAAKPLASQLAKVAGISAGLFGAEQAVVQHNRASLELDNGLGMGLGNTLLQSGAVTAMAAVPVLGNKLARLWTKGSNKYGKELSEAALETGKLVESGLKDVNPEMGKFLKRNIDDLSETALKYQRNPFGTSVEARVKFDMEIGKVADAFIQNKPVPVPSRPLEYPTIKMTPADKSLVVDALTSNEAIKPYILEEVHMAMGEITSLSKIEKAQNLPEVASVPVLKDGAEPLVFNSRPEAEKFLESGEGRTLASGEGAFVREVGDGSFTISKPAELYDEPSPRFDGKAVKADGSEVHGLPEDIAVMEKYPQLSKTSPKDTTVNIREGLSNAATTPETVPIPAVERARALKEALVNAPHQPFADDATEAGLEAINSVYSKDLVELLKGESEFSGLNDLLTEINELKTLKQPEIMECFLGGKVDVKDN